MAFPLPHSRDDADERRQANRAVAVSAAGLGLTGLAELLVAMLTGSVGLLGDAIHNLSIRNSSTPSSAASSGSGGGTPRVIGGVVDVHRDLLELVPCDGTGGLRRLRRIPPRPATAIRAGLAQRIQE